MNENPRGTAIRGRDGVVVRKPFVQASGTISHQRHWAADICGAELPGSSTPHLTDPIRHMDKPCNEVTETPGTSFNHLGYLLLSRGQKNHRDGWVDELMNE